ncbi:HAD family hydrolase [Lysobacter sp. CA196]|uniref:HAD family hydrolase n=1 Tax=Lysobacter sp. CA196 TaxID=3455606 RepID=UPI003F8D4F04
MLELVGFDGDDTLWHSEGYYQEAAVEFDKILSAWVDIDNASIRQRLLAVERNNLALFGYGVKGMVLSMIEAAIDITQSRISAAGIHRIVLLAKAMLDHPVELLPGIREAVEAVAARHRIVLITKGDLFHQEKKVARSGLADLFHRIEIVSEKDDASYSRVLSEFGVAPGAFAMVGNSLRSDIEPVIALGGWGIHMPYHVTWAHEMEHGMSGEHPRLQTVGGADAIAEAIARFDRGA